MKRASLILAIAMLFAVAARADEFHLKDGSTVIGTIVGYQGNSFRVKTSYGFALVDRNAIASITVSKTAASAEANAKPTTPENPKPALAAKSAETKTSPPEKLAAAATPSPGQAQKSNREADSKNSLPAATAESRAASTNNSATGAQNSSTSAPPVEPAPIPVREEVQGNLYINETYGFRIYKPPDWNVIEGARAALPGTVVAMGTSDQTTYLIIGLEPSTGTLQAHVETTNERLSSMFDGFHPSAARQIAVAGLHGDEYQFQGMANNQQWSGTVVLLNRGENFFTIFGVTSANTDLVQIQQNVISRTIASLQFTKPQ